MHICIEFVEHMKNICDNTTCRDKIHDYVPCKDCIAWLTGSNWMISDKKKEIYK